MRVPSDTAGEVGGHEALGQRGGEGEGAAYCRGRSGAGAGSGSGSGAGANGGPATALVTVEAFGPNNSRYKP